MKIAEPVMQVTNAEDIEKIRKGFPESVAFYVIHGFVIFCAIMTIDSGMSKFFLLSSGLIVIFQAYNDLIRGCYLDATFRLSTQDESGAPQEVIGSTMEIYKTGIHNPTPPKYDLRFFIPLRGIAREAFVFHRGGEYRSEFNVVGWDIKQGHVKVCVEFYQNRIEFSLTELALLLANQYDSINTAVALSGNHLATGVSAARMHRIRDKAEEIAVRNESVKTKEAAQAILRLL